MQVKLENRHYGAEQNKYKQTVITQWQGVVRNDYLKGRPRSKKSVCQH